jgi:hypothetical protein
VGRQLLLALVLPTLLIAGGCSTASTESADTTGAPSTTVTETTITAVPPTTLPEPTTTTVLATTTTTVPATTTTMDPTKPTFPVDDGHLAYECRGEGSPTVLIEMGLAMGDFNPKSGHLLIAERDPEWVGWTAPMDLIAATNRVCIYGRRGVLGSEFPPSPSIRSTNDQVDDLEVLIAGLDLETPLILVGHSVGGWNLRVFADRHPEQVVGVVMVDATDPDDDGWPSPFPPEMFEFSMSAWQVQSAGDFGDLPMYVISATQGAEPRVLEYQRASLSQSTVSTLVKVDAQHHRVYFDAPDEIAKGVEWVIANAG